MYQPPGADSKWLWVVGGKVERYQRYDMVYSIKQADVWYSAAEPKNSIAIGQDWAQQQVMTGDFFAQNADAIQPGKIAPWYQRFGHTLTAYSSKKNYKDDMMLLMGGFAPQAMNDIWVTVDGVHWVYQDAPVPWAARGWHSTVVNNGTLYIIGGSPLNSDVWRLDTIKMVNRTAAPLTRAEFSPWTYETTWTFLGEAAWAPRAGMHVLSHWYWNFTGSDDVVRARRNDEAQLRMVLVGGYGGYQTKHSRYDGMYTRGDCWASLNGSEWVLLNATAIPGRAWHGMSLLTNGGIAVHRGHSAGENVPSKRDASINAGNLVPPRMWIFGGGYIGGTKMTTGVTLTVTGWTDGYWSRDGITWTKVNYDEGGGIRGAYDTYVKFYSSQLWSKTNVNGQDQYLGLWGQTMEMFNNSLILIAGDKTGAGTMTSTTYQSQNGIFCDIQGKTCSDAGTCGPLNTGCVCNPGTGMIGEYCDVLCTVGECFWPPHPLD